MHAIFSWAACVKYYNNLQHLRELTEHVGEMEITKFYFLHLFIDIQDIAISTGRDFEEAVLIVHMVIDAIINCEENIGKFTKYFVLFRNSACSNQQVVGIVGNIYF